MGEGRSIQIHLVDGEVTGIRHAELDNWTGQAISCPWSRIKGLEDWKAEAGKPGVYLMFGPDVPGQRLVYIGESENVMNRLQYHWAKQDFDCQEVVFFTSKDDRLTKAHAKYLEHRLQHLAETADRFKVKKGKSSGETPLPRADKDAMELFIQNLGILLGALGYLVLIKATAQGFSGQPDDANLFRFDSKSVEARGMLTDEGFIVLSGAAARIESKESMGAGNILLKKSLVEQGVLVQKGEFYRFIKDFLFGTPSQAGSIVVGTSCNGRRQWRRIGDGKNINEIEDPGQAETPTDPSTAEADD